MTRADVTAILAQETAALRYLNTTPADLEAMPETAFADCAKRAADFIGEMGRLQMKAAKILREYKDLKARPCVVNDLAHRAQRMRDLEDEYGRIRRVLRDTYDCEV